MYKNAKFRQFIAALAGALSILTTGMSIAWTSPVIPNIREHSIPLYMDNTQISWMVSLLFLGNTISPIPSGYLMDIFGRKKLLVYSNVLPLSSWILTWYATYPAVLYIARFLNGLWSGTVYTVMAVYIGEIVQPDIRGSVSSVNNLFKAIGSTLVLLIGPYISYSMLAVVCGCVPVLFFILFSRMPESPYYYLMVNDKTKARKSLKWLRRDKIEIEMESELNKMETSVAMQTNEKSSFWDIFTIPVNRRAFIMCNIVSSIKMLSGFDVMIPYASITLPKEAFVNIGPNECVLIFGVVAVVACFLSGFILDRFKRKTLLLISSLGCCITTFTIGAWFFCNQKTNINVDFLNQIPFYCFVLHSIMYAIGLGPIMSIMKGELFSVSVKGNCSALTSILYSTLSFGLTKMYLMIADTIGMFFNYWLFSCACFLGIFYILFFTIETSGKTLQEIQDELNSKRKRSVQHDLNNMT